LRDGGGAVDCNSTNTGLGTRRASSSAEATTRTGTVCGWKPGRAKLTENSLGGIAIEHGVRQACPSEVRASAPAGSDSNCIFTVVGVGFKNPGESSAIQLGIPEHAARLNPQAVIAITRFMIDTSLTRPNDHSTTDWGSMVRRSHIPVASDRLTAANNGFHVQYAQFTVK
jgi:hypothetical protein